MRRIVAFNQVSLDGNFADADGDMSWAHHDDPEWREFVEGNATGGGELIFGRVTYEMMASFWPTPVAMQKMPVVAARMNSMPKLVFSRTLSQVSWSNTTLVKGDLVEEVRRLKAQDGEGLAILGSGSLIVQLAPHGLIDEYRIALNPIILGNGRSMFDGVQERLRLTLTRTRTFGNGNVLLSYEPLP